MLQKFGSFGGEGTALSGGKKLGSGPHVSRELPADEQLGSRIAQAVQELSGQASRALDAAQLAPIEDLCRRSGEAAGKGEVKAALSLYGQAVHDFVRQQRQGEKRISDSSVDLA